MTRWRALQVALALLPAHGCGWRSKAPPAGPPPPLEVRVSGCRAVRRGPVCEFDAAASRLRVAIRTAPGAAVSLSVDGRAVGVTLVAAGPEGSGWRRTTLEVAAGAHEIVVAAVAAGGRSEHRLVLAAARTFQDVEAARSLRADKRATEARATLVASIARMGDASERHQAVRLLARVEHDLGQREAAIDRMRAAIAVDRETGSISDEVDDRLGLAYNLIYDLRRFDDARVALADLEPLLALYPDGDARIPYFRGLIDYESGNLRAALRGFREAAERDAILGLDRERVDALQMRADTLAQMGRYDEAAACLREALGEESDPCRRAHLLNNQGWVALRAPPDQRFDGVGRRFEPLSALEEAVALYRGECRVAAYLANALTSLTLAELDAGHLSAARARLAEARAAFAEPDERLRAWWVAFDGRIALAEGRAADALRIHDELAVTGERALMPEVRLEAALGRAQALDALGRSQAARGAWNEADRLLDEWSRAVPLGEGRDRFVARYDRFARLQLDFLLRVAPPVEAATAARRSRLRGLSALLWLDRPDQLGGERLVRWERALAGYRAARDALDERAARDRFLSSDQQPEATTARQKEQARLRAALDEALLTLGPVPPALGALDGNGRPLGEVALPPPADGELLLVYHPVPGGWAAFALGGGQVRAARLGAIATGDAPTRLGEQLLAPFRDALEHAGRVRIAAGGVLQRVDFHTLPWNGRPLVERLPVVYTVDLPARSRDAGAQRPSGSRRAVVVSDPLDDLPAARREAARVKEVLVRGGWQVLLLEGRGATHAAVRAALEPADVGLLHYAGHARFQGRDGWESGLPLAAGGWLTLGDVMALPRAPERVVLSGCDTARVDEALPIEGLGLAQAFVLAGALEVMAASRPVRDEVAAQVIDRVYARLALVASRPGQAAAPLDLAAALAAVAPGASPTDAPGSASDWAAFRVVAH